MKMYRIYITLFFSLLLNARFVLAFESKPYGIIESAQIVQPSDSSYDKIRQFIFDVKASDGNLSNQIDTLVVYGVIMDWEQGGVVATTYGFLSGLGGLCLTNGESTFANPDSSVQLSLIKKFISTAQQLVANTVVAESNPLPPSNQFRFYILTNKGMFLGKEMIGSMEDGSSYWLRLFQDFNFFISDLRKNK
jgi:hypothetical protein